MGHADRDAGRVVPEWDGVRGQKVANPADRCGRETARRMARRTGRKTAAPTINKPGSLDASIDLGANGRTLVEEDRELVTFFRDVVVGRVAHAVAVEACGG